MGATIKCHGCGRAVDVTAPHDTTYEVLHNTDRTGARVVEIRVGKVVVHRCVLCRDGVWR
jgi:hypothetical protein